MNNPSPLVPQGSLQQNAKGRSYVKMAFFTVVAIHIVFFGGLINYVLTHDRVFREYVVAYTNAALFVRDDYQGPDELAGLFSGWQEDRKQYDTSTWQYATDEDGQPKRDVTLEHPRTIYQQLKRHFARYTPEMVERVCGIPRADFVEITRSNELFEFA